MGAGRNGKKPGNTRLQERENRFVQIAKVEEIHEKQKQNWQRLSTATTLWKSFQDPPVNQIWKITVEGSGRINLFINANAASKSKLAPCFSKQSV